MTRQNPKPTPEVAIFDLDNTLIPTFDAIEAYLATLSKSIADKMGLDEDRVLKSFADQMEQHGLLPVGTYLHLNDYLRDNVCLGQDPRSFFEAEIAEADQVRADSLQPSRDVLSMLRTLRSRGVRMMLFTEGTPNETMRKLQQTKLGNFFLQIYTGPSLPCEAEAPVKGPNTAWLKARVVALPKAHPKDNHLNWQKIIAQTGLDPEKILVVGDHAVRDVAHAQRCGAQALQACWYSVRHSAATLPVTYKVVGDAKKMAQILTTPGRGVGMRYQVKFPNGISDACLPKSYAPQRQPKPSNQPQNKRLPSHRRGKGNKLTP